MKKYLIIGAISLTLMATTVYAISEPKKEINKEENHTYYRENCPYNNDDDCPYKNSNNCPNCENNTSNYYHNHRSNNNYGHHS